MPFLVGVHRDSRSRVAGGRPRDPARYGERRAFPASRSDPVPHVLRDRGDIDRPGSADAERDPLARPERVGPPGASARASGRASRRRQSIDAVLRRLDELAAERSCPSRSWTPCARTTRSGSPARLPDGSRRLGAAARLALRRARGAADRSRARTPLPVAVQGELKDDARRRIENELDLREAHLMRSRRQDGDDDA